MRVLIVGGAGLMSAGTARDLLSNLSTGVSSIVAADANPERLAALKQSLPDSRLHTRVFDVNDRGAIQSLLADCDVCINGVPTFAGFQMQIFEACLLVKRPYVDYGGMGVTPSVKRLSTTSGSAQAPLPSSVLAQILAFRTSSVARLPTGSTVSIASTFIGLLPR